jgi:hypothetical protein
MTPGQRIKERLSRVIHNKPRPPLHVAAANDDVRRVLKHPHAGGFHSDNANWPDDMFTHRRIRDGSIRIVGASPHAATPRAVPRR